MTSFGRQGINASRGNRQCSVVFPNWSGFLEVAQITEFCSEFPELGIHTES